MRHALYSVAAADLRTSSKQSSLRTTEMHHRVKAIEGMQAILANLDPHRQSVRERTEAREVLLGCAILLSWYTERRYAALSLDLRHGHGSC